MSRFIYREHTFLGRQRLLSLIYFTLQITLVTVLFLPKAIAASRVFFVAVMCLLQCVAAFSFLGYLKKWLKLSNSLRLIIYSVHLVISLQMIYISVNNVELLTGFHKTLMMGNITLMVLNVVLSIIACQRHDPLVLSLVSLAVYAACAVITRDPWFGILAGVIVITFLLLGLLQCVAAFSFLGYLKKWLKLSNSLRLIIYSVHLVISLQMIYISVNNVELLTGFHKTLMMGNITLMVLNVVLSIIACQRHDPLVLSLVSLAVYAACAVITRDPWFGILAGVIVITFLLLGLLGSSLVWSTRKIEKENLTLKKEDEELFAIFNLRREQVRAYVRLAEQEMSDDKVSAVFDILGKRAQKNVMYNMKRYFYAKKFNEKAIGEVLPNLTPSEREVCRLVMQDRKLGDICRILQKNESNITTTRSNVRRKLGLKPEDDLKETLWRIMDEAGYSRDKFKV